MKITKLDIIAEFKAQVARPGSEAMIAKMLALLEGKPEAFFAPIIISDGSTAFGAMRAACNALRLEMMK